MKDVAQTGLTAARHLRGEIYEVRADGDRQAFRILFATEGRREQVLLRYRPIRDRAVEIAEIGRAAYREGDTDLLRLLDSERLRTETQLAYVRMLGSYHQSVIELERAGGMEP